MCLMLNKIMLCYVMLCCYVMLYYVMYVDDGLYFEKAVICS